MPPRKERLGVVLDTNVLIAFYLSRNRNSAVTNVIRLWRNLRNLQLIVSDEIVIEYLEVLDRVGVHQRRIEKLNEIINTFGIVTKVSLGKRAMESRDPNDNLFLSTAQAGKAEFLITNDRDLLEISEADKKRYKFRIVTPRAFLSAIGE